MLLGNTPGSRAGFAYRAITVCGRTFQSVPLPARFVTPRRDGSPGQAVPQPPSRNARRLSHVTGLASSAFAHHYSRNRYCFLFLRVLRCFTSPRYHPLPYAFRQGRHPTTGARFPHSETPGSQSGCRLPGAYRRLQRPSSAPGAKASTVCPKKLGTTHALQQQLRRDPPAKREDQDRCSRPLCSSQETDSTTAATPHPRNSGRSLLARENQAKPVPSGPNSVPTQPGDQSARSAAPERETY